MLRFPIDLVCIILLNCHLDSLLAGFNRLFDTSCSDFFVRDQLCDSKPLFAYANFQSTIAHLGLECIK